MISSNDAVLGRKVYIIGIGDTSNLTMVQEAVIVGQQCEQVVLELIQPGLVLKTKYRLLSQLFDTYEAAEKELNELANYIVMRLSHHKK